jgi:hypothetical protein
MHKEEDEKLDKMVEQANRSANIKKETTVDSV